MFSNDAGQHPLVSAANLKTRDPGCLVIGANASGNPIGTGLRKHHLIAGIPGCGKTNMVRQMISSLARLERPIDAGIVVCGHDYQICDRLAHLVYPVVQEVDSFHQLLHRLSEEQNRRLELLRRQNGVARSFRTSHIYVFIDDFAHFSNPTSRDQLARIAQKGRVCSMSLILSVQRASATIVGSNLLATIPNRIAFRAVDRRNSRLVIDQAGAERVPFPGGFVMRTLDCPSPLVGRSQVISSSEFTDTLENTVHQFGASPFVGNDFPSEADSNIWREPKQTVCITSPGDTLVSGHDLANTRQADASIDALPNHGTPETPHSLFSWRNDACEADLDTDAVDSWELERIGRLGLETAFAVLEAGLNLTLFVCRLVCICCAKFSPSQRNDK